MPVSYRSLVDRYFPMGAVSHRFNFLNCYYYYYYYYYYIKWRRNSFLGNIAINWKEKKYASNSLHYESFFMAPRCGLEIRIPHSKIKKNSYPLFRQCIPVLWPARSPEINTLNFCPRGHLFVYVI